MDLSLNVHVNFQHTENNQQFVRVGVLRDIYNTRWSIHLTHPSFLSLSIWAEANFPAGYGHARLIADLPVLFFRSKSIRNKQLPKFYLRKKRQLEKFVTFLKWKSFSYYTSCDLTSILVLSYLQSCCTTKVGYLCHCLHLHTVLLHICMNQNIQ